MKNFFGNDTIVILFVGIGFLYGIYTRQDTVTSACIGCLAGYLGNEIKNRLKTGA